MMPVVEIRSVNYCEYYTASKQKKAEFTTPEKFSSRT